MGTPFLLPAHLCQRVGILRRNYASLCINELGGGPHVMRSETVREPRRCSALQRSYQPVFITL